MPHRRCHCFKLRLLFPLSSAVSDPHYCSKVAARCGTWGDAGAAGAPPQCSRQRTSTHGFHSSFQLNIHLYIKLPTTTLCAGTRPGGDAGAAGAPPQRPGRDSGRAACPQRCAATAAFHQAAFIRPTFMGRKAFSDCSPHVDIYSVTTSAKLRDRLCFWHSSPIVLQVGVCPTAAARRPRMSRRISLTFAVAHTRRTGEHG